MRSAKPTTGLVVDFEVRNDGRTPQADVQVRISVVGARGLAPVTQRFAHLPAGARRKGTGVFPGAAADARAEAHVVGYTEP